MKKILSILAVSTLITTSAPATILCLKLNSINYNHILNTKDYIFGNQNDFTLIMNSYDFSQTLFINAAKYKNNSEYTTNNIIDKLFIDTDTDAKEIQLTDDDWYNIYTQLEKLNNFIMVSDGYIATLHIKNINNIYTIVGTNTKIITKKDNYNSDTNIKTDILNSKPKDCKLITTVIPKDQYNNNIEILFNIDLFNTLNNLYLKHHKKFNLNTVQKILNNNEFQFADIDSKIVINNLINSFKNNTNWRQKIQNTNPTNFIYQN